MKWRAGPPSIDPRTEHTSPAGSEGAASTPTRSTTFPPAGFGSLQHHVLLGW